jgi:hypothetical protein
MTHDDAARVAGQALRRLRGDARPVDHGLAGRIDIGQHGSVDVNHDLVALAGRARIHTVMERRLREQGEGVRLVLPPRWRIIGDEESGSRSRRNVRSYRRSLGTVRQAATSLVERLPRRRERLQQQGARLRLQPSADQHHAVFVLIHMERAGAMALGRFL